MAFVDGVSEYGGNPGVGSAKRDLCYFGRITSRGRSQVAQRTIQDRVFDDAPLDSHAIRDCLVCCDYAFRLRHVLPELWHVTTVWMEYL